MASKKKINVNKKQKLATSLQEKYTSAVFGHHKWLPDERLNCLQCYQTSDTLHHTFKTTGESAEVDIDIAVCYFPLNHAYSSQEKATSQYFIEFDLLFHKDSIQKIMRLYNVELTVEKIQIMPKFSCLKHKSNDYIHFRDLIAYLYDCKVPVDALGESLKHYEKSKADGSKTTSGVREALEAIGLSESLTKIWRKHWQKVRPDQVDVYSYCERHHSNSGGSKQQYSPEYNQNQMARLEASILENLPWERLSVRLQSTFALQPHQQYGVRWMYLREQIKYFGVSGGILADLMGMGKTLQMLSLIVLEPNCCKLDASVNLVVCKLSVLHQWQEEAEKFFPGDDMDVFIYYNGNGNNSASWEEIMASGANERRTTVVLTTYDQLRERFQKVGKQCQLMNHEFHRVVCDEGHQIANANSATALALSSLKARHRWVLSGSPYRNSPRDLFSLIVQFLKLQDSFLDEDRFGRKARWNRAFTRMDAIREFEETGIVPKFNLSPFSIRDEARIESWLNVLMLRRTINHSSDLPDRVNHEHICNFHEGSEEQAIYEHVRSAVESFVLNIFESGESFSFTSVHGGVMLLRRICVSHDLLLKDEEDGKAMWKLETKHSGRGPIKHLTKHHLLQALPRNLKAFLEDHKNESTKLTSKITSVKACLDEILSESFGNRDNGLVAHKLVAFSQWSGVLDMMEELIRTILDGQLVVIRIDGATSGRARAAQCASFSGQESTPHMLLLNYKAAGEGLNLQMGQHVLLLDPWFTPSVEDQAIARVYRQGNTNKQVHVHRFVVERSIEQRVQQISDRKRSESQRLLSMGLVHRARMVQNTVDLSKDAILGLLDGEKR